MPTVWKVVIGCSIGAAVAFAFLYFRRSTTAYSNEEKYTWVDYKGNKRELIVTRDAKVGVVPSRVL
jgi:hypothetical protein